MTGTSVSRAPSDATAIALRTDADLSALLLERKDEFAVFAKAAGTTPEVFIAELAVCARKNDQILQCTHNSIVTFIYDAMKTGLEIGRGCFAVPIKNHGTLELNCWIGYKGMKELVIYGRSARDAFAEVVFEGDAFEEVLGLYPDLTHRRGPHSGNMDKAIGVYGVLVISQTIRRHIYLARAQIDRLRKMNRADTTSPKSPWVSHPEQMWKAKALLAVLRDAPRNARLAHGLDVVERNEGLRLDDEGKIKGLNPEREVRAPSASATVAPEAAAPAFEEEGKAEVTLPNWRDHRLAGMPLSKVERSELEALYSDLRAASEKPNFKYEDLLGHIAAELDERRSAA